MKGIAKRFKSPFIIAMSIGVGILMVGCAGKSIFHNDKVVASSLLAIGIWVVGSLIYVFGELEKVDE